MASDGSAIGLVMHIFDDSFTAHRSTYRLAAPWKVQVHDGALVRCGCTKMGIVADEGKEHRFLPSGHRLARDGSVTENVTGWTDREVIWYLLDELEETRQRSLRQGASVRPRGNAEEAARQRVRWEPGEAVAIERLFGYRDRDAADHGSGGRLHVHHGYVPHSHEGGADDHFAVALARTGRADVP